MLINVFIENFNNKDAKLYVLGGGKLINNFRKYIYKKGFQNKIKLYDFVSRKDIFRYYQNCDCFVMPSHKETFGLALFEALLFKKHFITSRHAGYYELKNMDIRIPNFNSKDEIKLKKLMLNAFNYRKEFNYKDKILKNFGKKRFLEGINRIYK